VLDAVRPGGEGRDAFQQERRGPALLDDTHDVADRRADRLEDQAGEGEHQPPRVEVVVDQAADQAARRDHEPRRRDGLRHHRDRAEHGEPWRAAPQQPGEEDLTPEHPRTRERVLAMQAP
jgi:hypothetical protein